MKQSLTRFIVLTLMIAQAARADDPKRVALVIGNSEYDVAPLKNPVNDADAVSFALQGLGFTVTVKKNVTKTQIEAAVDAVTDNLQKGDVCLIFYAGHGQGFENENYLIPIGATLDRPQHVKERCVSVSYLLSALRYSECSLKVVVVDACRNNPFRSFARSDAGLQRQAAPDGTIVSFSTSPKTAALDGTGDHSPYVKQLVGAMRSRADEVEIVRLFREVSQAVKIETGQRPHLDFDASMPDYFLKRQRDLAPDIPRMKVKPSVPATRNPITNSIGMKLRLIPAGTFEMGSSISAKEVERRFRDYGAEASYFRNEHPQHRVRIAKSFYAGIHEVTIGQFRRFVSATGYETEAETDGEGSWGWNEDAEKFEQNVKYNWRNSGFSQSDTHPVVNVTWNDAVAFCNWLSREDNRTYRLPTEAEWEYACRAETTSLYSNGNDPEALARIGNLADGTAKDKHSGWSWTIRAKDGYVITAPVGRFPANGFGLHDMHGNVYEWCSDWYGEDYYTSSPATDPPGSASGSSRVLRGGSWYNRPYDVRSAYRFGFTPDLRLSNVGFRVVCESE